MLMTYFTKLFTNSMLALVSSCLIPSVSSESPQERPPEQQQRVSTYANAGDGKGMLGQAEVIAVAERFVEDHGYTRATEIIDGISTMQYERRAWGIRRVEGIWQVLFLPVGPRPYKIYHLGPDGGTELDV